MALTRRELLVGAGAGLLLSSGCGDSRPLSPSTPAPPAPAPRMHKGISLIGDINRYDDTLGVRPYLLDGPQPTTHVGLWISWSVVQPLAPDPYTRAQAFGDLSDPAGPAGAPFAALDAQIARAAADGRGVSLTLYQSFPAWSHPSTGPLDPLRDPGRGGSGYPELGQDGLPNDARIPDDLTPDGPWAWFVAYLCARYARTNGVATPGPGSGGATVGNPSGAHVDRLQAFNEPNLTWWPRRSERFPQATIVPTVETMMRTAAVVAADAPGGPSLLLPATADVVSSERPHGVPWDEFTDELLGRLRGWRPRTPVAWAHHNYADVKHGPRAGGRWRVEDVLELQRSHGWPAPEVWLTEGGYQFAVRPEGPARGRYVVDPAKTAAPDQPNALAEQVAALARNWTAMSALPVRLWTQYQVNDSDVAFQSSLRGPVRRDPTGAPHPSAAPYPAYGLWPTLGV